MKVTIVGAGSTYTPELVEGFLQNMEQMPVDTLCLMDIDERKGGILYDFSTRMVQDKGAAMRVMFTTDLDEALAGADFVLTQVRVGKLPARVLDEKIPLKYGLLGQETTGIGGFFKALRTIPVLYDVAQRMQRLCPGAWLINFANPSGIITEMLLNHTSVRAMGLCNVPINMISSIQEQMDMPDAKIGYLGLNHLSWVTSIQHAGKEYIDEAIRRGLTGGRMKNIEDSGSDYDIVRTIRAIPSSYLEYFYFQRQKLESEQQQELTRGEQCIGLEEELLGLYQQKDLVEKPEILNQRGGHRYSEAAVHLIRAIHGNRQETHVVDIRNEGCIPFMNDDDVVEVPATIGKDGATRHEVAGWNNPHIRTLMRSVKEYEKLTVRAALQGDDRLALEALTCHPLLGDFPAVKACYEEMKQAHKAYLPTFFGGKA